MGFVDLLKERAKKSIKTIVLPETEDMRTLEAADKIFDGGEIHSCEDLADPTEVISDRYACSLYGITTFKPSEYAIEEDFPNEVVLLVRGWSVADFMSDWTKLNAVDE